MSEEYWTSDEIDVGHFIGPALNATNVPLDTVIFVGLMRASTVGHPELSPQVYVSHREEQSGFPAWLDVTFYFSEPLKSGTNYNVSLTIAHKLISWNFTTTTEPFTLRYQDFPSRFGIWFSVNFVAVITLVVGWIIWKRRFVH